MKVKDLHRGDLFCKRPIACPNERQVWVRGDYDRSTRRYSCTRWGDICDEQLLPGTREVFTAFTF